MKKILFICHGNICRSPMAEFVMKDLVKKAGLASRFYIESAATSREEIGNPVYPPARRKLAEHGISCNGHAARQLTNRDYDEYDLLIGIIVEQESSAAALNALLHEYGGYIIGRMGLPYRERGVNIISVVLDAPQDKIAALSGKIGRLPGVSAKTQYSNVISREGENQ